MSGRVGLAGEVPHRLSQSGKGILYRAESTCRLDARGKGRISLKRMASFRVEWLQQIDVLPANIRWMIAMDPASSDDPTAAEFAIVLVGFWQKKSSSRRSLPNAVLCRCGLR